MASTCTINLCAYILVPLVARVFVKRKAFQAAESAFKVPHLKVRLPQQVPLDALVTEEELEAVASAPADGTALRGAATLASPTGCTCSR